MLVIEAHRAVGGETAMIVFVMQIAKFAEQAGAPEILGNFGLKAEIDQKICGR